ncbi:Uncharacterised protein [Klebsiella pneumoniae]|nr:Uncharacterised protein [Klebsiella pneumoniae]VGH17426.1 Uncharacterised protein [Klebsiella quasipneumoniae]SAY08700.1 Uncharacterised protein [Klebsiella pneumoniae]SVU52589.1 Uncharacterised protein [Klebsiella pneumoniae]SVV37384.1 Uncharacterised protein [Klebsiella pneumoniae]
MHGSPKLSMSVSACGVFIVNTKNTSFIAVQCQRFTMLINIAPRGFKVRKRGLRFNKQQFHQFAGCIINVDQRCAGRATAFKPVMITAVNLYQFTSARTPVPWLRDPCGALFTGDP